MKLVCAELGAGFYELLRLNHILYLGPEGDVCHCQKVWTSNQRE